MAKVESVMKTDGVADDPRWESVAFAGVHRRIIEIAKV
jgi:hypothetical protein